MRVRTVVCYVAALLGSPLAHAKISGMSLAELIRSSDQIVIATVTRVTESTAGSRTVLHATAAVKHTLKGSNKRSVRFVAFPSFPDFMDSTETAIAGETILLFLSKHDDGEFGIKLAGRGRMPLRRIGGKTYATLSGEDVFLPSGAPVVPGPDARYSFIVSVDMGYLEQQIAHDTEGHLRRAP